MSIRLTLITVLVAAADCMAQPVNTAKLNIFFSTPALHGQMMGSIAIMKSGKIVYKSNMPEAL